MKKPQLLPLKLKKLKGLAYLQKRAFILIEVLIAMMLLLMALTPLLAPHVQLAKAQSEFVQDLEAYHFANLVYGDIYEKLQFNKIPLEDVLSSQIFEIDPNTVIGWEKDSANFKPQYSFTVIKFKGDDSSKVYKITLNVQLQSIQHADKKQKYCFDLFIFNNQTVINHAPAQKLS